MLIQLSVRNYVLIKELEWFPATNLNSITGETGAGKSMLLGAIGLLLGDRADSKVLLDGEEKCVIEGIFNVSGFLLEQLFMQEDLDYDEKIIIRREILPSGKSRAFVNDSPVTLDVLKKIMLLLMDIHSQHDNLQLAAQEYQLRIVDTYAQNETLIKEYQKLFYKYRKLSQALQKKIEEKNTSQQNFDYQQFLLKELRQAKIQKDEQGLLEKELLLLESREEIQARLTTVYNFLSDNEFSTQQTLGTAIQELSKIANLSPDYQSFNERLRICLTEIKDISSEIFDLNQSIELDTEKLEKIHSRLNLIQTLEQKHHVNSVEKLLRIQEELEEKINGSESLAEEIQELEKEMEVQEKEIQKISKKLTQSRLNVIPEIEKKSIQLLKELEISTIEFKILHQSTEITSNGKDSVCFMFSANKGIPLQELKSVASGGEFSRLMLVIKYLLANKQRLPTVIFDEIDTGISGEVSIKVAQMLKEMAQSHQIIVITHLPQIAAKANKHYFVYKDNRGDKTKTHLKELTENERIKEIAQMIGGKNPSEAALLNAKELVTL